MIKFMYIAKRLPSLTPQGFTARWRQHGALAVSLPFWKNMVRYVQADLIRPAPLAGTSMDYDAVASTVARDDSVFTQPSAKDIEDMLTLQRDETETFSGPISPMMLMVEEDTVRNTGAAGTTAFLLFNDLAVARTVAQSLADQTGEKPVRIVMNRVLTDKPMSENPQLHYKAIVEVSSVSVDTLKSALEPDRASWRKADLAVVAHETVLTDTSA